MVRSIFGEWFLRLEGLGTILSETTRALGCRSSPKAPVLMLPLWALYGDLDGHHHGGDLINPLLSHIYYHHHTVYY